VLPVNAETVQLSIIIPIYNVEKYLADCLDSLLKTEGIQQTEILLVDDGSTDDSGKIASDYSRAYNNIEYYHKENGGSSDARNYGLRAANGRYVFFVDADDIVDPEQFSYVLRNADTFQEDIVFWDCCLIDENERIIDYQKIRYLSHSCLNGLSFPTTAEAAMLTMLSELGSIPAAVWLGMFNKEFLINNNLWFHTEFRLLEDELWMHKVMVAGKTLTYLPRAVYQYRLHDQSKMHSALDEKTAESIIVLFSELYKCNTLENESSREQLDASITKLYLHTISRWNLFSYDCRDMIPKNLLWKKARGMKNRIRAAVIAFSGRLYCFLTKSIRKQSL